MSIEPREASGATPAGSHERPSAPVSPRERALATTEAPVAARGRTVRVQDLHAYYGAQHAVRGVSLEFRANEVTAIIGPSGCGKSTLVRCINRMHEEIPGARIEGKVMLDDV